MDIIVKKPAFRSDIYNILSLKQGKPFSEERKKP